MKPEQAQREARQLWCVAPGRYEMRGEACEAGRPETLGVRTLASAVSRGTERLVLSGAVPASEFARMRAPLQRGEFPFPVLYGYQSVGVVEDGPEAWLGRRVFALHPHADRYRIEMDAALVVPDDIPSPRACLAANMETALNALWDGGATAGQRIVVFGGGVVGLLATALAARLPGADVTLVDISEGRRPIAESFGAEFRLPQDAPVDADLVLHASGSEAGLRGAIASAGLEGTIVEMSWFGDRDVSLPLGGPFHSRRLRLVCSQVGAVAPSQRPRWNFRRRLAKALSLLGDARYDALVSHSLPFEQAPMRLPALLATDTDALAIILDYT